MGDNVCNQILNMEQAFYNNTFLKVVSIYGYKVSFSKLKQNFAQQLVTLSVTGAFENQPNQVPSWQF